MAIRLQNKCPKCGGTSLLPFRREDGSISPHCKIFCDCHPVYGINGHDSTPSATFGNRPGVGSKKLPHTIPRGRMHLYVDDFDFPMSYDVYRGLCQYYGWPDPGSDRAPEIEDKPRVVEHIHRHSEMGKKEYDLLQQTALKADYLLKELKELSNKKKVSKYVIRP